LSKAQRLKNLTIRDRINFSYILGEYELKLSEVLNLKEDPGLQSFRAFVNWFIHTLPDDWKDNIYYDQMDEARKEVVADIRPSICGHPLDPGYCEKNKIPLYEIQVYYDPFKQQQAVINLLYRLGLLSRVKYREISTGRKFQEGQKDIDLTEEDVLGDFTE
jgi:hypothetical protein